VDSATLRLSKFCMEGSGTTVAQIIPAPIEKSANAIPKITMTSSHTKNPLVFFGSHLIPLEAGRGSTGYFAPCWIIHCNTDLHENVAYTPSAASNGTHLCRIVAFLE